MFDLNYPRIERIAIVLSLLGTAAAFALSGLREAVGFLLGALVSFGSLRSWVKIARLVGNPEKPPGIAPALLLALRYPVVAVGVYVTIKLLGIAPVALLAGLLVSFSAVLVELVYGRVVSR